MVQDSLSFFWEAPSVPLNFVTRPTEVKSLEKLFTDSIQMSLQLQPTMHISSLAFLKLD